MRPARPRALSRLRGALTAGILVAGALAACGSPPRPAQPAPSTAAAHVAEGQRLRREACPVDGIDGLCATLGPAPAPAAGRCGPTSAAWLTLAARDAAGVSAARAHFEAVLADPSAAPAEVAAARLALGDLRFEDFLAVTFPEDLDFAEARQEDSARRFRAWIDGKNQALMAARRAYVDDATHDRLPAAAAVRVAQLFERFGREVALAAVPADVAAAAETRDAYCDALAEQAQTLLAEAARWRDECRAVHGNAACAGELEPRAELGSP